MKKAILPKDALLLNSSNPFLLHLSAKKLAASTLRRHRIQLEVNRGLYMDEKTLEPTEGFDKLHRDLKSLVTMLLETDPRRLD